MAIIWGLGLLDGLMRYSEAMGSDELESKELESKLLQRGGYIGDFIGEDYRGYSWGC